MTQPWKLDRRTFLRGIGLKGVGATLALPLLECMGTDFSKSPRPRRFCAVYFPYGVSMADKNEESAKWRWFPSGQSRDFQFHESLRSLEPLRDELSILGGLSHPKGRSMGGHDTADIWLTGAELKGRQLRNTVSLDQVAAAGLGEQTRFRSLTFSTDGGVGEATRSSTLSFASNGQPIPALNQPRLIFNRLFGVEDRSTDVQRNELQNSRSMLDLVLEHSKSIERKLGKQDQAKLDEYLSSVREIEQRVERAEAWLNVPKPNVNAVGLHLDADDNAPGELIKTMFDLIFLAFQTDSSRIATYQLGNMNGATSIAGKFPQLLGFGNNMHGLAHGWNKPGGAEALGKWDQFRTEQLFYFLQRLRETPEGDGNLLDHSVVMYGSSNCSTHNNTNYPIVLAGGTRIGLHQGQFLEFTEDTPFSNVHLTVLRRLGVDAESFADSTGEISGLLS
jgi:hypothetical protein